jgi:hypothetical protein
MSQTVTQIIPLMEQLPHAEKFVLVHWLLTQLAKEEGYKTLPHAYMSPPSLKTPLLDLLATLEDIDEAFPDIDENLLLLDDVRLQA